MNVDYGSGGRELRQWRSMVLDEPIKYDTFDRFVTSHAFGRLSTDFSKIARAASASLPSAPGAVLGSLKASDVSYTQQDSCEKVPQTSTVRCPVHAEGYRLTSVQIKLLHADRSHDVLP